MAKIIHASQMLETPQVNILNDNVIDSVNYSYNETTMPFSKLGSFSFSGYLLLSNEDTEEQEITAVYNDNEYNPNITDLHLSNITTEEGVFKITDTYLTFNYIFNYSGNLINPSTFSLQNSKFNVIEDKKEGGDVGISTDEVKGGVTHEIVSINTKTETVKIKFKVLLKVKYIHTTGTISVPAGSEWSTLYFNTYDTDFYANKITTNSITNDENSEFTLESNELIQHNTAIYNMQISKYIAGNIKTVYKDGKATISMQVIDDGTEYDVNDIVQPMQTKVDDYGYETEYPLLTNKDGTPKTFEITSSELVFDGSGYYNIDAVEIINISKEEFTYNISWTTGGQLDATNKVIIVDTEGKRYYNGYAIKGGTVVTVSFNADSGDKLNYLKVNGATINDGSTLVVYEDIVISYSYDAPRDYLDESENPIDEMGFGFTVTQTSGLQDVIYNPRSNELYGVVEIGIPSDNGMQFEPLIALNASDIKFSYASYDGGSGNNYLAINMNTDTLQINMNLSSSSLYGTNLSIRYVRYLTITSGS